MHLVSNFESGVVPSRQILGLDKKNLRTGDDTVWTISGIVDFGKGGGGGGFVLIDFGGAGGGFLFFKVADFSVEIAYIFKKNKHYDLFPVHLIFQVF